MIYKTDKTCKSNEVMSRENGRELGDLRSITGICKMVCHIQKRIVLKDKVYWRKYE